ncbi:MAG: RDD family protein [Cryobacterium sp.]|nr:RDD family protein [Cryobacterium sp.]
MAQTAPPIPDYKFADDDELITGEAVALSLRPTPFVLRAAGAAIDVIVILTVTTGIFMVAIYGIIPYLPEAGWINVVAIAILVFCFVVIPITVELLSKGRSLGKLAVGARIVRDDGGAIGFRHAFIRALVGVIENFMTAGGIAILVALLDSRSRRVGDLLAGTYSQHERISAVETAPFGVPIELLEWSRTADVARLPDRLARRISQFLKSAGNYAPTTRTTMSIELANEASAFVAPVPDCPAELFLAGVVAIRRQRDAMALASEKRVLDRLQPVLSQLPHQFPDR